LAENEDLSIKTDLLETVLEVIHGQRGQNVNELVSLLALSNLLGIISFLNTQDLKFDTKSSSSKAGMSELKEMAASLLGSMGGAGDKKINPATLLNLMKTLSAAESSGGDSKNSGKSDEKKKD
jgi:L-arabinose isomerase